MLVFVASYPTMAEQLAEYESQLADIEALLEADPSDESVQKLRADLVELIALTKSELASAAAGAGTTGDDEVAAGSAAASSAGDTGEALELPPPPVPVPDSVPAAVAAVAAVPEQYQIPATVGDGGATAAPTTEEAAAALAKAEKKKKKKKKDAAISEFEIPERLQPLPSDTDAERKKKTRAIKALKSKHREKTKEVETAQKQRSWQDFVSGGKKKKKRKGVAGEGSIFATEDGVQARTGVVGGGGGRGTVSGFDDRKRHKH